MKSLLVLLLLVATCFSAIDDFGEKDLKFLNAIKGKPGWEMAPATWDPNVESNCTNLQYRPKNSFDVTYIACVVKGGKSFISAIRNGLEKTSKGPITSLPDEIVELYELKELWLQNLQIQELPVSITNLVNMTSLLVINNNLKKIPEFSQNSMLSSLRLDTNLIQDLPESALKLPKLTYLSLSNNMIVSLPDSLPENNKLHVFQLGNNYIRKLPGSITMNMPPKSNLYLSNNYCLKLGTSDINSNFSIDCTSTCPQDASVPCKKKFHL